MKKRFNELIAGVLIGSLLTSGAVFAKQNSEIAELFYNNIKIFIDGAEIIPKDANGNVTEPFVMNGTTYLPVRAVSSAFSKDVEWDGATKSVYIGKKDQTKPDNYLDKVQYNDYQEAHEDSDFSIINGTVTDFNKNIYTNGLLFWISGTWAELDDDDKSNILVAYPLNSQYSSLKGKIVIPKEYNINTWEQRNCSQAMCDVFFYGDGRFIYKATAVTSSMPFNIDLDVRGVNQLTVKIKAADYSHIALTDLALYK